MKPIIGITMGDPAGIGPEILIKALSKSSLLRKNSFIVFGDHSYLSQTYEYFKKKGLKGLKPLSRKIPVVGDMNGRSLLFGQVEKWAGQASGDFIRDGILAAKKGQIQALVTLPINKQSFAQSTWGEKYTDHTQMLASLSRSKDVALMLAAGNLRAVHVTQHVPLRKVPSLLTRSRISKTIQLTLDMLKKLNIKSPRIAVCGLNPHAGDGGVLGREEIDIIRPVVQAFKRKGVSIEGPLSADVVWPLVKAGKFHAGVAMYHDQGQIPVKMEGKNVVNITLGLPFIRTSVGHGTAFDIAGKGMADPASFINAVETAASMINRSERHRGKN